MTPTSEEFEYPHEDEDLSNIQGGNDSDNEAAFAELQKKKLVTPMSSADEIKEYNEFMQSQRPQEHDNLEYPTDWHMIDFELDVECRQISMDTFELRSPKHIMMLNAEGFNLWRDNTLQGQLIFQDWLVRNDIKIHQREPEVENGES